jgi:hypothetical protein
MESEVKKSNRGHAYVPTYLPCPLSSCIVSKVSPGLSGPKGIHPIVTHGTVVCREHVTVSMSGDTAR